VVSEPVVSNADVAGVLSEIADLLDLVGERFKPEAYRRAARSVEALPEGLGAIAGRGELRSIPGIGEAISEKIAELLRTGTLGYLERLRAQIPTGVLELMRLPGVGPKTARRFWVELGIGGPRELREAIDAGRLAGVKGFAEKKISQLRSATDGAGGTPSPGRVPIETVWPVAQAIVAALRNVPTVREAAMAGSFRRGRESVGDLDILVTAEAPENVFDVFSRLPQVREVRLRGPTKETVVLDQGLQVDLRVVEPESFGAAMQYFTGSKDHNVRLRSLARDRGLKVNEYGVYRGDERIAGRSEEEVYGALGLAWIPPELREDRGEIVAAATGSLPRLIEASDLATDPHVHLRPDPAVDDLELVVSEARTRKLRSVGVVIATVRDGRTRWTAPAAVLDRILRPTGDGGLTAVVELEGVVDDRAWREVESLAPECAVYAVTGEVPRDLGKGRTVRLIAHAGGPAASVAPVVNLARSVGAAVEVGPGAGRFDSTAARVALDSGLRLSVPTGVGEPTGSPTASVALGFARRAGATRDAVLNARAPAAPPRGATETTTSGGRSRGRARPRR